MKSYDYQATYVHEKGRETVISKINKAELYL